VGLKGEWEDDPMQGLRGAVAAAALVTMAAACGGVGTQGGGAAPSGPTGDVTVLAGASLTEAFTAVGRKVEARYPGLKVKFSFGGSSTLASQIQQGIQADVFASADQANMQKVVVAGLATGSSTVFARNRLVIAVEAGNPKRIASVSDLSRPGVKVDVCAPAVPCGSYATAVFGKAGVKVRPVSQEQDVKSVVTKVSLGEADAGICYVTDVKAAGSSVQGIAIPEDLNVTAEYPIVALHAAPNAEGADVFVGYVMSEDGQNLLASFGFGKAG
jgi:molybdate transport system substrate-binding protein